LHAEPFDGPFDPQAVLVDRGDMLGIRVAEENVVPVAC
jgi:hypothetical protein